MKVSRVAMLIMVGMSLSSCSIFSPSARRERAYAAYVRKSSLGRVKQQKRFQSTLPKMPETPPSAPVESSGPESVTSSDS